ncbi:MAG: YhgE/Pip family protein [Eubacterium sp.]
MSKRLKKESKLHKFIKEHFMIIVVFAIMLIPSIYTVLFLGSMWDPYGNTGSLPVAVVNEDRPVIYNGEEVNVGQQLVENLRANDSLQFNFVDEQIALDGLENGTYYMVMVIPDNFSANSTTLTTDNPQKMEMEYYVNPGTNYIASKFGESAVKTIKESLNKTVINTYATTIYSKLDTIGAGFSEAADGSNQIYNGVGALREGNAQITDGLDTLSNGCLTLKEGTGTLKDGLASYTDGVTQVDDGINQLVDGSAQLSGGVNQLQAGVSQIQDGTKQLTQNNAALNEGADQLLSGLQLMSDNLGESLTPEVIEETPKKLESLTGYINQAQEIVNKYEIDDETMADLKEAVNNTNAFVNSDEFKYLYDIISYDVVNWDEVITTIESLEKLPLPEKTKQTLANLKELANKMKKIQGIEDKISADDVKNTVGKVNGIVNSGNPDDAIDLNAALNEANESVNSIKSMFNGLVQIQDGLDRTMAKDGETGLIEGMTTLKSGIAAYTDGVTQVDGGVNQVADGLVQLGDGVSAAGAGIDKLYTGTQQLVANNKKLNSGADQLNGGAVQLYDGSLQLYDGSLQIDDGCEKLMAGANTLELSLRDGAKQIEQTNTGEDAADMLSQPVETNEIFQRTINSNGEAMSAYMMCAGLWVACLAFCLMFSPFKTSLQKRKTFIGHGLIAVFVAVVAPIIMVTLIMAIDGMQPAHVFETYAMAVLVSVAFMSIVYFLNTLLDSIGSFVLLVLLCLNLSGAAGTYPIDLSPKFYQIIHPLMPFTYGVDAFRSTISTGNSLTTDILVFLGISIVCTILTCITYEVRRMKRIKQGNAESRIEEEEELEYYNTQTV